MKKIIKLSLAIVVLFIIFSSCKPREKCPAFQSKVNVEVKKYA